MNLIKPPSLIRGQEKTPPPTSSLDDQLTVGLWDHQKQAYNLAKDKSDYALFMEMGTGKTLVAITLIRRWAYEHKHAAKPMPYILVLCPKVIIRQWCAEIDKFSKLGAYTLPILGSGVNRSNVLVGGLQNGSRIIVANYEALLNKYILARLKELPIYAIIADESDYIKNHKAQRTKALVALSTGVPKKIIMTGTPYNNSYLDLFSQFMFLDKGKAFETNNYYVFLAKYFVDKNAGLRGHPRYFPEYVPKPDTGQRIKKILSEKSYSAVKSDCLSLPPLVKIRFDVDMSKEQAKAYRDIRKNLITYVKSKKCVAANALVKTLRLLQVVQGFCVSDTGSLVVFEKIPRIGVLEETLLSIGKEHKIIVWATYKPSYTLIKDMLVKNKISAVELHGDISESERKKSLEEFKNGDTRVFLTNQKAGGVGLNLAEASYSVYYGRTFSFKDDAQSEARNYRGGSDVHEKVTRIDLITPNSIDEAVFKAIMDKKDVAESIIDFIRENQHSI